MKLDHQLTRVVNNFTKYTSFQDCFSNKIVHFCLQIFPSVYHLLGTCQRDSKVSLQKSFVFHNPKEVINLKSYST